MELTLTNVKGTLDVLEANFNEIEKRKKELALEIQKLTDQQNELRGRFAAYTEVYESLASQPTEVKVEEVAEELPDFEIDDDGSQPIA